MADNFFYFEGDNQKGPYDLVTMMQKIRNGQITQATPTLLDDGKSETTEAINIESLHGFFQEAPSANGGANIHDHVKFHINQSLQAGMRFLQNNLIAAIYTGILLMLMVGVVFFFIQGGGAKLGLLPSFIFCNLLLSIYMAVMLRLSRGQPLEFSIVWGKIQSNFMRLIVAATITSILCVLGFGLLLLPQIYDPSNMSIAIIITSVLIIPCLFVITLFIFAPLLITERGLSWVQAMSTSRKAVMGSGIDNFAVIFALVVVNFISLLFVVPAPIAFPVTYYALCEIYDEFFY